MNRLTGQPEYSGTSIVDVSDPAQPRYLAHIPGLPGESEQGGAQMVRVCDGKTLPNADASKTYMLRVFGGRAHEMWDVTDPANPTLVTTIVQGPIRAGGREKLLNGPRNRRRRTCAIR